MKRLLKQTGACVDKSPAKYLSDPDYKNLCKRYRNVLTRGGKELPPIPVRRNVKRGLVAELDAHNLRERFKCYEEASCCLQSCPMCTRPTTVLSATCA